MGYFVAISSLHRFKARKSEEKHAIPVSVIIAAKDEEHNLTKFLPTILSQVYDDFEVIVVDDHSVDGTLSLLQSLCASHDNLQYATLDGAHGKKSAITLGIELAKNDWLLFTDADCSPISGKWISSMMLAVLPDTSIVLGYSPFMKTGGLVNAMARVDAFSIGVQYLAFALLGRPYMGVGRNMAYRKSLFQSSGGFEGHKDVLSGDDDLFVQGAASALNTTIAFEPDAQTTSESKTTLIELFIQKRRHVSTGFRYKKSILVMLGLVQVNNLLFYTVLIASVFEGTFIWIGLALALLRFYSQYVVLKKTTHRLGEVDLLLLSLNLELPLAVFNLLVVISNIIYDTRRWS
jgi:glycosyltransferase involved in cell wall biosynthesis